MVIMYGCDCEMLHRKCMSMKNSIVNRKHPRWNNCAIPGTYRIPKSVSKQRKYTQKNVTIKSGTLNREILNSS